MPIDKANLPAILNHMPRTLTNLHPRRLLLIIGCVLISLYSVAGQASQSRVALIIGDAAYQDARLKNPVNDARLMADTLAAKGFSVTTLENAGRRQMLHAIRAFTKRLDEQSIGLFYFAGHGIELDGNNYLVPVDSDIVAEEDIEYEGINAGRLLDGLKRANNGLNLVVMDGCRNNPIFA
jgi:uncharacterized caspase-like protein